MQVTRTSSLSGKVFTMELDVTQEQLDRFEKRRENGEYVQTIFPHLTSEEREFIMTGISPTEWDEIFNQ
jgi:hypothetical protein